MISLKASLREAEHLIKPIQFVKGMEKALPDYSERLKRRTGVVANLVEARLANHTTQKD